jgi:hypothetical protein
MGWLSVCARQRTPTEIKIAEPTLTVRIDISLNDYLTKWRSSELIFVAPLSPLSATRFNKFLMNL